MHYATIYNTLYVKIREEICASNVLNINARLEKVRNSICVEEYCQVELLHRIVVQLSQYGTVEIR